MSDCTVFAKLLINDGPDKALIKDEPERLLLCEPENPLPQTTFVTPTTFPTEPDYMDLMVMYSDRPDSDFFQKFTTRKHGKSSWSDPVKTTTQSEEVASGLNSPLAVATEEDGTLHFLFTWEVNPPEGEAGDWYETLYQKFDGSKWTQPKRILPLDAVTYFDILNMEAYDGEAYIYYIDDNADDLGGSPGDNLGVPTIMRVSDEKTFQITPPLFKEAQLEAQDGWYHQKHFMIDHDGIFYVAISAGHFSIGTSKDLLTWDFHVFHDGSGFGGDTDYLNNFTLNSIDHIYFAKDVFGDVHLALKAQAVNEGGLDTEGILYLSGQKTTDSNGNRTFAWESADEPELVLDDSEITFRFEALNYVIDSNNFHHILFFEEDLSRWGDYATIVREDFKGYLGDPPDPTFPSGNWVQREYINNRWQTNDYIPTDGGDEADILVTDKQEPEGSGNSEPYLNVQTATNDNLGRIGVLEWQEPATAYQNFAIEIDFEYLYEYSGFFRSYPGFVFHWTAGATWKSSSGYFVYFAKFDNGQSYVELRKKKAGTIEFESLIRLISPKNFVENWRLKIHVRNTSGRATFKLFLYPSDEAPSYLYKDVIDESPIGYAGTLYGIAYLASGIKKGNDVGGIQGITLTDLDSAPYIPATHGPRIYHLENSSGRWTQRYFDINGRFNESILHAVANKDIVYVVFTTDNTWTNGPVFLATYDGEWSVEQVVVTDYTHGPAIVGLTNIKELSTTTPPAVDESIQVPTEFEVTTSNQSASWTWKGVEGADGFNLYRSSDTGYQKVNPSLIDEPEFSEDNIPEGDYQSYVKTVKDGKESDASAVVSFTSRKEFTRKPPKVISFDATPRYTGIDIEWEAKGQGLAISRVEYHISGSWTALTVQSKGTHRIQGLSEGSSYSVQMRFTNSEGWTETRIIDVTTKQEKPSTNEWPVYSDPGGSPVLEVISGVKMDSVAGLPGIEGTGTGNHPSSDPNDWTAVQEDLLNPDNVWGIMCAPTGAFKVKNGVGVIYTGNPWFGESSPGAKSRVGNLALGVGTSWADYGDNPVLYESQPWQSNSRIGPTCIIYNPNEGIYYAPYGEADYQIPRSTEYYGKRAVGLAWSKDLLNWKFKSDAPWFTHDMAQEVYPEKFVGDNSNYERSGKIYSLTGFFHDGSYYVQLGFSNKVGGPTWIRFQDWNGPYEAFEFSGSISPEAPIFEYDGKFYSAYADSERLNILVSNSFGGPYSFITGSGGIGLFEETVYDDMHLNNYFLFMHDDVWYLMYAVREGWQLEEAYSHIPRGGSVSARVMKLGYYDPEGKLS